MSNEFSTAFSTAFDPAPLRTSCVPFDPDYTCCHDWAGLAPDLQERATALAWSTLRALTGGRVGNCPVTVRPCLGAPCDVCSPWWRNDLLGGLTPWVRLGIKAGEWVNCLCASPECSCEQMCEIVMPGEVAAIVAVIYDGTEMDLAHFRVDNGNRIVRTDGECWPSCQNMNAPLGYPGTLGITYLPGILPDSSGLWAAGVLACEFAKACDPSTGKCRLPSSVTSLARQGVTFTVSSGMFADGMTGIREVDAYLVSVNPHGLKMPPMVWSPDVPWAKHRYQTSTAVITP